ncbi:MAG TPA: hypothetical protein VFW71_11850 [Actinomycetota bacterium]|nr:hypothetical protein [Actinomycetota bacterium]
MIETKWNLPAVAARDANADKLPGSLHLNKSVAGLAGQYPPNG